MKCIHILYLPFNCILLYFVCVKLNLTLCPFRYIFALNMFDLGCINSTEWAVYQDWHSLLVEQFGHQVELEGIIYLRAPPQV